MSDAAERFTLGEDDPRTKLINDRGRRCTPWWVESDAGRTFFRRWVRTPDGWDYEDQDEAP